MPRILIVENNPFFRQSFREILNIILPEFTLEEAANGEEVFSQVDANPPDVIFMDLHPHGVNGLELTKEIKSTHPGIFIIILTNYDYLEYQQTAHRYGADRLLLKDAVSGPELASIIRYIRSKKAPFQSEDPWYAPVQARLPARLAG